MVHARLSSSFETNVSLTIDLEVWCMLIKVGGVISRKGGKGGLTWSKLGRMKRKEGKERELEMAI